MRVRRDQSVVLPERVGAVTRPGIRARMRGESRAHRVLLDVAHAREQVPARVHGGSIVGLVPHRILVTVRLCEVARIACGDGWHQSRRARGASRREEQMHMISHQRISVDCALRTRRAFAQRLEIGDAVSRAGKAGATFASALHDVQRGVGFFRAGKARHGTPNNAASRGGVDPVARAGEASITGRECARASTRSARRALLSGSAGSPPAPLRDRLLSRRSLRPLRRSW